MWEWFQSFMARPFRAEMSALDWFLFLGLILIIMILWRMILRHIGEAIG